ncbi:MAG: radical SAM protein [Chitinivibrionales bacterium]|nr:radical SAM protein [Chitinivibrionales bacterium]
MDHLPSYRHLLSGEWNERIRSAFESAGKCRLCPRSCGVNRICGVKGFCKAPGEMYISSIFPHHGEEPPVSGTRGSGTVFFSQCTLKCIFCQNYQISHLGEGRSYTPDELAQKMIGLQNTGCHNINLVTPDHFLPWILQALRTASNAGLAVPIVYNCSGYESVETLRLLSGIVDIYLPDMKYHDTGPSKKFSSAENYTTVNQAAIREMFRQVGPLKTDSNGIAYKGLLVRHLVLPGGVAGSEQIVRFLAQTFDPDDITVSVMAQYRPLFKASHHPDISRRITFDEYEQAKNAFQAAGFDGYYQELKSMNEDFVIDFTRRKEERLKGGD